MDNGKFQELVLEQLKTLADGQTKVEKRLVNLETRLENEAFNKITALFDGYKSLSDTLADHTSCLVRIEEKVTGHDIKIEVLDRTKTNKRAIKRGTK